VARTGTDADWVIQVIGASIADKVSVSMEECQ